MNFYFQLIIKSWKNYENLDFSTSGLCLAFKKMFGLFSIFQAFIQIWVIWSNFAIKTIFAENLAMWISVFSGLIEKEPVLKLVSPNTTGSPIPNSFLFACLEASHRIALLFPIGNNDCFYVINLSFCLYDSYHLCEFR